MNTLTQRHHLIEAIQTLPDDSIDELANFIHYLQYKKANLQPSAQTNISVDSILNPNKTYEVWTPIDAPEAAQTLMSLLDAQTATSNG
jgi:hypothetical protein